MKSEAQLLPFINIRDLVVFPEMEVSLVIGRAVSVKAIEQALRSNDQHLVVISQKRAEQNDNVGLMEMYTVGTVCKIEKSIRMDDAMKIFIVGLNRWQVSGIDETIGVRMVCGNEVPAKNGTEIVSESDRNEIAALVKSWCSKLQFRLDHPNINHLADSAGNALFIAKVMEIISYRKPEKQGPGHEIAHASEMPLSQSYQEYFELNQDVMNRLVADRQKVLEEHDLSRVPSLLKDLLARELQAFAS